MPIRKTNFYPESYYHIYNKGIDNRLIFQDDLDYQSFQTVLAYYLTSFKQKPKSGVLSRTGLKHTGMFEGRVNLLAYSLLPTQFHLLLRQTSENDITDFMTRVGTAYAMYFNQRNDRSGTLFQGRFQAKHIDTLDYLLQTSKHIHLSPQPILTDTPLATFPYSSYEYFLNHHRPDFQPYKTLDLVTKPDVILHHFGAMFPGMSYQHFVETNPYADWYLPLTEWIK